MSYTVAQIEKATKECKPLKSRRGTIINAEALANNPACNKKTKIQANPSSQMAYIIGGIVVVGVVYFLYFKK